jgi:hypothetical protein
MAALVLSATLLVGCASTTNTSAHNPVESADRRSGVASVGSYLDMLASNPHPNPDAVIRWVADRNTGGKAKARDWLQRHPDAKVTVGKRTLTDRGPTGSADSRVDISIEGEACPAPTKCAALQNSSALFLVIENGEYLLRWDSALKILGYDPDND